VSDLEEQTTTSPAPVKSSAHERVSQEMSWLARRVAAMLLGIWLGGILLVSVATPAAFSSVDSVLTSPSAATTKALKLLGPATVRELLFQQVGESNRGLFTFWGYTQLTLAVLVFLLLLFFSTVRRPVLGLSLGMLLMALLMNLFLIPRIGAIGRELRAGNRLDPAEALERFKLLHMGFTLFEIAVALLGIILAALLLRARSKSTRMRRRSRGSEVPTPG
jgi:hypothetical protein